MTLKKVRLHKESAKPKFNLIVKLTKKYAKGQQKDYTKTRPVGMDMPLAGCRGHRSCGQPLGGGSCGGGLQQGEATGQVGGHCMVARGVNRRHRYTKPSPVACPAPGS